MRQLLPTAIEGIDPAEAYADVLPPEGRPFLRLNMIASVDGAASVDGMSGSLGSTSDHRVFLALRSLADVILVAAGTTRAENYGAAQLSPAAQAARQQRGQTAVPAIAVISRSARLDWQSPLFTAATVRPLLITVADCPADQRARAAEVADVIIAGDQDVKFTRALGALADRGARSVLAEGGPSLNGQLAVEGLIDEVCLTVAPRLIGGAARRILSGDGLSQTQELHLQSICEENEFLFLRFRVDQ